MTTTDAQPARDQPPATQQKAILRHGPEGFRRDIEGLRAVAVGLVLADHVFGRPSGGFIGVDVFFVISGFLITGLLVRERERTGRISFRAFYVRRARRLLPAALATLTVTTLAAWLFFVGGRFWNTVQDGVWALFLGANINVARQSTDYFQQDAAPSPFQHFWSLAVEEQFYVVWPVLILAVFALPLGRGQARTRWLPAAISTVLAASFLWSVHATVTSPATAYFSTFTRAWELALGALVAVTATRLGRLPDGVRSALAWLGLAGIIVSAFVLTAGTPFPGSAAALPVLSTGLLMAFGNAPGGPTTRWALGNRAAGFLGRISYSLYLWHWPVVVMLAAVLDDTSALFHVSAVTLSLGLATVSYYAVEQPVLHSRWLLPASGGHRDDHAADRVFRRARNVALAGLCGTAAVGLLAGVAFRPGERDSHVVPATDAAPVTQTEPGTADGGRPAVDPLTEEIEAASHALTWPLKLRPGLDELPGYLDQQWSDGCFNVTERQVDDCLFGDPGAAKQAVVLGDSIAGAWVPGLVAGLEPAGWSVQTLSMGLCPNILATTLLFDQPFTLCAEHRAWALARIEQTRPDLVVLSDAYNAPLADATADRATVWRDGLTAMVQRIQRTGARVVVLARPPGSANLQSCAGVGAPTDCAASPSDDFREQVANEAAVAVATGATAIDPQRWFCVDTICPAFVGRTPVYADGVHMTAEYAQKIGPVLAAAVLQE